MLHKSDFQKLHPEMHEGMSVYTIDGEKLGRIRDLEEDILVVEKGFFFPKNFTFHYDDIADVHDNSLIINKEEEKENLKNWPGGNYEGWDVQERRGTAEPSRGPEAKSESGSEKTTPPRE